jgi:UPF0755 protein
MKRLLLSFFLTLALGIALVYGGLTVYFRNRTATRPEPVPSLRPDIRITLIEGLRREEIAAQLDNAGICPYADFLQASEGQEGFLFPDTYRFFPGTGATEVLQAMRENFTRKVARSLNPTMEELTLASIVEREARNNDERSAIAGVYRNRLEIGMTLDADPTVQYAKDSLAYTALPANNPDQHRSFRFWQAITREDYRGVRSPYNTYLNPGLPPGPIANPGRRSIMAAQDPDDHDYYYFLHKGEETLFSRTLQEHEAKQ